MITLGIDPGMKGALAVFGAGGLSLFDMPTFEKTVGGKKRDVMDHGKLGDLLDEFRDIFGVERTIVEQVSGMPGQASGFAFGFGVGCLHQALHDRKMGFETVTPAVWKKAAKVPKDKKEAVLRADQVFPHQRPLFRTARGALRPDRAEAALLAWWGAGMP